ncbi:TlpA family protein disulfide reductase [Sphingomonas sp. GCM10030256]|uniref:TlpA family protein disulfide reductase n=1 Tax=Sphingomonas sp. GCM10030256 TaxID=3273427 RepID=UPI003608F19E
MRGHILLMGLLALSACDRQNLQERQEAVADRAGPKVGLDRTHAGKPMPTVAFRDPDGQETSLAAFSGKPLLLNLWATWCAPCIKELPTLDALASRPGAPQVLALSQDMGAQPKVEAFLAEKKIGLEPYQDPDMAISGEIGAKILPTTILYDASGREVWRYTGDLDWSGVEAQSLIGEAR